MMAGYISRPTSVYISLLCKYAQPTFETDYSKFITVAMQQNIFSNGVSYKP